MKKSNLDEMREQKLLQIEHTSHWMSCWGLLAVILIQAILGADIWQLFGELAVLLLICGNMVVGCLRHGLWDRTLKPDRKTNLLASLLAGAVVALAVYIMLSLKTNDGTLILTFTAIACVITFILCFGALTLCAKFYKKRRRELDDE